MKKRLINILFSLLGFIPFSAELDAQSTYSLEALQSEALKNNPLLKVAYLQSTAAKISTGPGFSGMLPSVQLAAGWNTNTQNASLTFNNGSTTTRNGAGSTNINAGVMVNQTLFDGFRMFAIKDRLMLESESMELNRRQQEKWVVEQLANAWWQMVRDLEWLNQLDTLKQYYSVRLTLVQNRLAVGKGTQQEVLQAQYDVDMNKAAIEQRKLSLQLARISVNVLLDKTQWEEWLPNLNSLPETPRLPDTSVNALKNNHYQLQALYKDWMAAQAALKAAESIWYPTLTASGNINLINNTSEVGVLLKNQTIGGGIGINLNYTLYNGGVLNKQIKIAKLNADIAAYRYKQTFNALKNELYQWIFQYQNAVALNEIYLANLTRAKDQLQLSLEAFKAGTLSQIELVLAQGNVENAYILLLENKYRAIQSVNAINRINGAF